MIHARDKLLEVSVSTLKRLFSAVKTLKDETRHRDPGLRNKLDTGHNLGERPPRSTRGMRNRKKGNIIFSSKSSYPFEYGNYVTGNGYMELLHVEKLYVQ